MTLAFSDSSNWHVPFGALISRPVKQKCPFTPRYEPSCFVPTAPASVAPAHERIHVPLLRLLDLLVESGA